MLINKTQVMQVVKIVLADGTKDSINIQPNGRAEPPAGSTIDPVAFSSYKQNIAGIERYAPAAVASN